MLGCVFFLSLNSNLPINSYLYSYIMGTRHITPLFGGNHGIHVLKKCKLILLHHLTSSPFLLGYKQNVDCSIPSVRILLLSWRVLWRLQAVIYANKIQRSRFAKEVEGEVLFAVLQIHEILCVWGIFLQRGK